MDRSRRRFLLGSPAGEPGPLARIGAECLEAQGVSCQACRDSCATRALRFGPAGGRPVVDPALCTGCGDCAEACPPRCITVEGLVHG